ncbi:glycoside hydrolase family 25 protein [Spirillospora sp. NPDC052242]
MIYGVDVASYQGNPDWKAVYADGIRFAFSKVTESTGYTNPTWAHNRAGMLALGGGFLPGAYHFLHGGDGAAQARYFLDKAGDVSAFAVALDVEASGADAATARAWVAEFKDRTGGHPVIGYYPRWYWEQTGRPDLGFFDTIWQSHYVSGTGSPESLYAKVPASWWTSFGGEPISILQFTSSSTVQGISGRCDANAYRGGLAELKALALGQEDDMPEYVSVGTTAPQDLPPNEWVTVDFGKEYADGSHHHEDQGGPSIVIGPARYALMANIRVTGLPKGVALQARAIENAEDGSGYEAGPIAEYTASDGDTFVHYALPADTVRAGHRVRFQVVQYGTAPARIVGGTAKAFAWPDRR